MQPGHLLVLGGGGGGGWGEETSAFALAHSFLGPGFFFLQPGWKEVSKNKWAGI